MGFPWAFLQNPKESYPESAQESGTGQVLAITAKIARERFREW